MSGGYRPPLQRASKEIELTGIGRGRFLGGWKRKIETEAIRETLAGLGREAFEMVVHEGPNAPRVGEMPLDLKRPTLEGCFAFPKKLAVTMDAPAVAIVFRGIIAEKPQVKEISRSRQEFERGEIAFAELAGVGPNPADAVFLKKANELRTMPAGMAKLDRKAEVARELFQEFPQRLTALLRREGGRQLNEDDLKLRFERFHRAQKSGEFGVTIAQAADMGDFPGKLARKTKNGRGMFHPAPHRRFRGSAVEGGIDLNSGKVMRIKFQPAARRQVRRIKVSPPFLKAPRAGAKPDFLLCREIQWTFRRIIAFHLVESCLGARAMKSGPAICLPWPT